MGIAVNLITPALQRRAATVSQRWAERLRKQEDNVRRQVEQFRSDGIVFASFLVFSTFKITLIQTIAGTATGVLYLAVNLIRATRPFTEYRGPDFIRDQVPDYLYTAAQLISLIAVIATLNIARRTLQIARQVRNFDEPETENISKKNS